MKKKIGVSILSLLLIMGVVNITGCGESKDNSDVANADVANAIYTERDMDGSWDENSATKVTLSDETGSYEITSEGCYVLTGKLSNGQVVVKVGDQEKVQIVLNGASITNKSGPAILVESGDKVFITLADGTSNFATDGTEYTSTEDEPFAAIFSKSDLTINGSGSLKVTGNYNNGIGSKDDLKICGGNIEVASANHGIKGKDMVGICAGTVEISAQGDGIKSNNTEDENRGYVTIDGGTINITKCVEGIEARNIYINDGEISITSSDDGINATDGVSSSNEMGSQEGISIEITGGTLHINTGGDGIDSNGDLYISGGDIVIEGESVANEAIDYAGEYNNTGGTIDSDGYSGGMGGKGGPNMNGPNGNFDDDRPDRGNGFDGNKPDKKFDEGMAS